MWRGFSVLSRNSVNFLVAHCPKLDKAARPARLTTMKAQPLPAGYKQPPYVRPSWATPYRSVRYSWVDATGQVHHCEGALARVDRWGCATVQHKDGGVTHQTYPHCDDLQPAMEMK